jgi:hypothetical protein
MGITSQVDAFVAGQNLTRGKSGVPLDYDILTTVMPSGGNAVTGISGIAAGATPIALKGSYNALVLDGAHSTAPSASSPDSYSFNVDAAGTVNILDNNTGQGVAITGDSYLVFDGGATTTTGAYQSLYIIGTGTFAQIAAMYNAAFVRQPDLPGLEYYMNLINTGTSLHQAAVYFLASPEFATDYPALTKPADNGGPNDQGFITELYGQILHRSPTSAEVAYYVNALQNVAGTDRAQLLIYFALSPENQADISGWLINTSQGGYADSTDLLPATTVIAQGAQDGYLNTALIGGTIDSSTYVSSGGTTLVGKGYQGIGGLPAVANQIDTSTPNITVRLSPNVNVAGMQGPNQIVYSASAGGSDIGPPDSTPIASVVNDGGTIYLAGSGNTIMAGGYLTNITTPATVYGFNGSDYIHPLQPISLLLQGSAGSPISGATYASTFSSGAGIAINVGSVAADTAAAMVAVANTVYTVADIKQENVTFIGEDPVGNTVIWHWTKGDINQDRLVDANSFTGAELLIGVAPSVLTASTFQ